MLGIELGLMEEHLALLPECWDFRLEVLAQGSVTLFLDLNIT